MVGLSEISLLSSKVFTEYFRIDNLLHLLLRLLLIFGHLFFLEVVNPRLVYSLEWVIGGEQLSIDTLLFLHFELIVILYEEVGHTPKTVAGNRVGI